MYARKDGSGRKEFFVSTGHLVTERSLAVDEAAQVGAGEMLVSPELAGSEREG